MPLPFDTANNFFRALETNQLEWAKSFLSEDFEATGWTLDPLDKYEFIDVFQALFEAFPDFSLDPHAIELLYNGAWITIQMSGTHEGLLDLTAGLPIEPTHKHFKLAKERPILTISNEQITAFHVEPQSDAGLRGIFEQLGVPSPFVAELPLEPQSGV